MKPKFISVCKGECGEADRGDESSIKVYQQKKLNEIPSWAIGAQLPAAVFSLLVGIDVVLGVITKGEKTFSPALLERSFICGGWTW